LVYIVFYSYTTLFYYFCKIIILVNIIVFNFIFSFFFYFNINISLMLISCIFIYTVTLKIIISKLCENITKKKSYKVSNKSFFSHRLSSFNMQNMHNKMKLSRTKNGQFCIVQNRPARFLRKGGIAPQGD